jgi:hypothetical protein
MREDAVGEETSREELAFRLGQPRRVVGGLTTGVLWRGVEAQERIPETA